MGNECSHQCSHQAGNGLSNQGTDTGIEMRVYTLKEAAAILNISVRLLRRYIREGRGPRVVRLGERNTRITHESLWEWVRSRTCDVGLSADECEADND